MDPMGYIYMWIWLVGGLEHEFYDFPYIGNVIVPTDYFFQMGSNHQPDEYMHIVYMCQP